MSAAGFPPTQADDKQFSCHDAAADAVSVAHIRTQFYRWLRRSAGVDGTRACDVILAVNEALANTAEFAYLEGGDGTVDVEAVRDPARGTLTVTVADRGRWREINPLNRQRRRGRGIPLMRTLADSVTIDISGLGTSVCLRFEDVAARLPVGAGAR